VMGGAFADAANSKAGAEAVGMAMMFLVLVPAIIGMSLGFSAKDRNQANPISLWVALIWNIIIIACFLLLCLIGLMK
jgi:hypothetical protein